MNNDEPIQAVDVSGLKVEKIIDEHARFVADEAFAIAECEAELTNEYIIMHIKDRPKWIPNFLYRWILSKVLVLTSFKKYDGTSRDRSEDTAN